MRLSTSHHSKRRASSETAQNRIIAKLDDVVDSEWRDPDEFLEPLTGGPFSKLRVGQYRLACILDRSESALEVHRIEHRSGAYTADDD